MNFEWMVFVELGIVSLALLIGTVIRANTAFFQRFLIPNSITGGVLLLLFYTFLAPRFGMDTSFLENMVFHLLNISFVAMSLRKSTRTAGKKGPAYSTSVVILSQYVLQGVLGFFLTIMLIKTFIPDLFPTFGFFIPMGFCLGPGQAFAIGSKWEAPVYGFEGSGSVGLTFAAIGFFWAIFGGMVLVNIAIRKGWVKRPGDITGQSPGNRSGLYKRGDQIPIGAHLTTQSEAIESFSFNFAIVLVVYLITFLFLQLVTYLLSFTGPLGAGLAESLWGISFIFAALFGLGTKKLLIALNQDHVLETGTLTRTAGFSVDFMVAASIGAISVAVVARYWIPILIMGVVAGFFIMVTLLWMSSRIFFDFKFERTILLYGALTGTLPSGLTLLRVVDPEFRTPAASDYIPAAGLMFVFAIPYILMVDLPAYGYRYGEPLYYWITAAIFAAYLAYVGIAFFIITKGRRKSPHIWRR
jgi:ESS family glutamate:Na+ symporter